jgi:hypothetical protein
MIHIDFNQILSSIEALSPEQVRMFRQQVDRQHAQPKKSTIQPSGKSAKRIKPAAPKKKPPDARRV